MEKAIFALGKSSIKFERPVYIRDCASIAGTMEGKGPLAHCIDEILKDDRAGMETWEEAESKMQEKAVELLLKKSGRAKEKVRYLFAGDLIGQSVISTFGVKKFEIPYFGLFGACSVCSESLVLGAMTIAASFSQATLCVASSHYASAQKEFRLPLEYGAQRPLSATRTVTGCAAFLLTDQKPDKRKAPRITAVTPGRIVDYGVKDSLNMGCAMAPAAADTISQHFEDMGSKVNDYDLIVTGDLGEVGSLALYELLLEKGIDIRDKHMDCGLWIYDLEKQKADAGGSGCGCSAVVLAAKLLPELINGKYNKILFLSTGALLSKLSFNEGKTIPAIAHALLIEC